VGRSREKASQKKKPASLAKDERSQVGKLGARSTGGGGKPKEEEKTGI